MAGGFALKRVAGNEAIVDSGVDKYGVRLELILILHDGDRMALQGSNLLFFWFSGRVIAMIC